MAVSSMSSSDWDREAATAYVDPMGETFAEVTDKCIDRWPLRL